VLVTVAELVGTEWTVDDDDEVTVTVRVVAWCFEPLDDELCETA
jgi:hypothetical protein